MSKVDFKGKTIWMVGASSGIGEAMVYEFDKAGANLIISSRREERLNEVKSKCNCKNIHIIPLDLTNSSSIKFAIEEVKGLTLDLVIMDAGIAQKGLVIENSIEVDRKIMETNYFGTVALTKAIMPIFLEQKHGWFGVVTSIAGMVGVPGRSSYSASKHALHGFFDSLRAEIYDTEIEVSLIMPGFINTHITVKELRGDGTTTYGKVEKSHKLGMSPEECARRIVKGLSKKKNNIIVGGFEILSVYIYRFTPEIYDIMIRSHPMKKWRQLLRFIGLLKDKPRS